jgi:hypothetical protein
MTKLNAIPDAQADLVTLATKALAGAQSIGAPVGLLHHPAAAIAPDVHDYIGDPGAGTPGSPPAIGKRGVYNQAKADAATARAASRDAALAGREFCGKALSYLKPTFGYLWNSAWSAAGFTMGTLIKPRNPVPLLLELRAYFRANPARESTEQVITAARADLLLTQLQTAQVAEAAAKAALAVAKVARDGSYTTLRGRMSGLRVELGELLEDDDARWYQFGFKRPADGRIPALVPNVVLSQAGTASVRVEWGVSSLAENYRVTWRLAGGTTEPTEVGLFTDRQCSITGLPSGVSIVVGVSARNDSGETEPTEAAITVG